MILGDQKSGSANSDFFFRLEKSGPAKLDFFSGWRNVVSANSDFFLVGEKWFCKVGFFSDWITSKGAD